MPITKYNMAGKVEETMKTADHALFEARRAHERLDKLPAPAPAVAPAKGERGAQGIAGRDGKNGRDGINAVGINGTNGTPGKDGRDGAPGPDSAAVLAEARAEIAALKQAVADLTIVANAALNAHQRGREYVEFLQSTIAQRKK